VSLQKSHITSHNPLLLQYSYVADKNIDTEKTS